MITADCASRRPRGVPPSGLAIVSLHDALNINAAPALRERLTCELHRGPALLVLDRHTSRLVTSWGWPC